MDSRARTDKGNTTASPTPPGVKEGSSPSPLPPFDGAQDRSPQQAQDRPLRQAQDRYREAGMSEVRDGGVRLRGTSLLNWVIGLGYVFLYAPILVLMIFSFNDSRFNVVWRGFTLDWYMKLIEDTKLMGALKVSLIVAVTSTAISLWIGTLSAWVLYRYGFRGKRLYEGLLYLPIIIPDIVMGISLVMFFVLIQFRLGIASIIIAHVAFNISFVTVVVLSRLHGMDRTLEEAAMDLGADEITTFVKVTLPLLSPGLIAAALLAFTLSFDDFVISFFTAGVGATPLPVQIYSMVKLGISPVANAISTLVVIASVVLVALADKLQRTWI